MECPCWFARAGVNIGRAISGVGDGKRYLFAHVTPVGEGLKRGEKGHASHT
ncbi:hypothetical protein CCHOA_06015 [Corynebacterium choanae]|uniref:Uncharacterized protein n=1 Tax=Corynebacterium choanae TaxID=1862358 RepID=A0A3G6J707_9CORY|nr:hypothetical protein CCHOA_06015 [Corynebacterium choanae]